MNTMKRSQIFIVALLSTFALIISHLVAIYLRLYWSIWWLDLVFHFWGGVIAGSVAVTLFVSRGDSVWKVTGLVSGVTLLVALLWEAKEWITDTHYSTNYIMDTISDILLGVAGGLVAALVAHKALNSRKN